ncbi:MAG: phosphatidylserine decarboxylase [Deltaproteobacteria bacterium]|nr:phosphatidylserine decarboxylase [Deltaproteobacteria bacterium]
MPVSLRSRLPRATPDDLLRMVYRAASGNLPSRGIGRFADLPLPRPVLDAMVASYCRVCGISLGEAEVPAGGFPTFDAFFTRRLKPGARVVDASADVIASPSDGRVQSVGRVERGMVVQAKGRDYELCDLLGDRELALGLEGGPFLTIYLSPRDYHRVHFPCDGEVAGSRYSPGRLYTVAPRATRVVPRLFAQNERITTIAGTAFGQVALVMVGATGVGRISVSYCDLRTNVGRRSECRDISPPVPFRKGDELGTFHLGSTVVLVLEPGPWSFRVGVGDVLRMGQPVLVRG